MHPGDRFATIVIMNSMEGIFSLFCLLNQDPWFRKEIAENLQPRDNLTDGGIHGQTNH